MNNRLELLNSFMYGNGNSSGNGAWFIVCSMFRVAIVIAFHIPDDKPGPNERMRDDLWQCNLDEFESCLTWIIDYGTHQNNERKLTIMSELSFVYTFYNSFPQWKLLHWHKKRSCEHFGILMAHLNFVAICVVETNKWSVGWGKIRCQTCKPHNRKMHNIFAPIFYYEWFVFCALFLLCFNQNLVWLHIHE